MDTQFRLEDPILRAKAKKELKETDQVRTDALSTLRNLLDEEQRMPSYFVDEILMMYLRTTKFNVDAAFNRMKRLSQFLGQPMVKQWLSDFGSLDEVVNVLKQVSLSVSESLDQEGRRVVSVHIGKWNPEKTTVGGLLVALGFYIFAECTDSRVQVGGIVVIADYKAIGFKQIRQMTPAILYLIGSVIKDCAPIRVKQVHFVNVPFIFRAVCNVLVSLTGKKIQSRLQIHGEEFSTKRNNIPLELISKEFGGSCPTVGESPYLSDILNTSEQLGILQCLRDIQYQEVETIQT